MNTFYKYQKYKKKYNNLKKQLGGHFIESSNINESIFPFENIDATFAYNGYIILLSTNNIAYNTDENFNFIKVTKDSLLEDSITFEDLYDYTDCIVKVNKTIEFNFSLFLLNDLFDIFKNLYKICTENTILTDVEIVFINKIFTDLFVINVEKDLIKISGETNILFKFIFINKFKELLKIIYTASELEEKEIDTFLKEILIEFSTIVFPKEFYINYSKFIHSNKMNIKIKTGEIAKKLCDLDDKSKNQLYDSYLQTDINDLKKLIKFIKITTKIPLNHQKMIVTQSESFTKYSTSLLFFTMYYGEKLKYPLSSLGYPRNKLYPINLTQQLKGLKILKKNPNIIIKNLVENTKSDIPKLYDYSTMVYSYYTYPDCVENTILQFLKMICWDGTSYNSKLFINIRDDFYKFIEMLNSYITNTNAKTVKDEFSKLLSGKLEFKAMYKKPDVDPVCEIKSTVENFFKVLSYIFEQNLNTCEKDSDIKKFITTNAKIISIIYKPSLDFANIEIKSEKIKIIFNINNGHSKFQNVSLNNIWKPKYITEDGKEKTDKDKKISKFNYFDYFILLNNKIEYYPEDWDYHKYYNFNNYFIKKTINIAEIPSIYINFLTRESIWIKFYYSLDQKDTLKYLPIVDLNNNKEYIKNILDIGKDDFLDDEFISITCPYYKKYRPDLLSIRF